MSEEAELASQRKALLTKSDEQQRTDNAQGPDDTTMSRSWVNTRTNGKTAECADDEATDVRPVVETRQQTDAEANDGEQDRYDQARSSSVFLRARRALEQGRGTQRAHVTHVVPVVDEIHQLNADAGVDRSTVEEGHQLRLVTPSLALLTRHRLTARLATRSSHRVGYHPRRQPCK